jgi:protein-S-isoprenylcysteine O-methyltransferase Ste14
MGQPSVNLPPMADRPGGTAVLRLILGTLSICSLLAALLFLSAGRWNWTEAWALVIAYGGFLLIYGIRGAARDPEQLQERRRPGAGVKSWDKVILPLYSLLLLVLFPVCGLDAGRFRATSMPPAVKGIGWLAMILAGWIILRVMAVNTYASRTARIQRDRGQTVVTGGPYRFVRHPMYLGIIVLFLSIPLALGSGWGLIPAGAIGLLYILRTALEDRMLADGLPGYREFMQRTRHRLFPGIW